MWSNYGFKITRDMTLKELKKIASDYYHKHPSKKEQILGYYELAEMEIEMGESESRECEKALYDLEELLKEEI